MPDRRRLAEADRAEVARHLDAVLMRRVHRRLQLGARDVHVRLERRRPLVGPIVHRPRRVLGPA